MPECRPRASPARPAYGPPASPIPASTQRGRVAGRSCRAIRRESTGSFSSTLASVILASRVVDHSSRDSPSEIPSAPGKTLRNRTRPQSTHGPCRTPIWENVAAATKQQATVLLGKFSAAFSGYTEPPKVTRSGDVTLRVTLSNTRHTKRSPTAPAPPTRYGETKSGDSSPLKPR